jgi:hypothetical protein
MASSIEAGTKKISYEALSRKAKDHIVKAIPPSSRAFKETTNRFHEKGLVREKGKGWVENPLNTLKNAENTQTTEDHGIQEVSGFQQLRQQALEREVRDPKMVSAIRWFIEESEKLPKMTVESAPLTDEKDWVTTVIYENQSEGNLTDTNETTSKPREVAFIKKKNSTMFNLEGRSVKKEGGTAYLYPTIVQRSQEITIPTKDKEVKVDATGVVGVIRDKKGRMLLGLRQEYGATTDNHVILGSPYQTSVSKLENTIQDNENADEDLKELFSKVHKGKTVYSIIEDGEVPVFPGAHVDGQRIEDSTLVFSATITDKKTIRDIENKERFFNDYEFTGLVRAGLINGLAISAEKISAPKKILKA